MAIICWMSKQSRCVLFTDFSCWRANHQHTATEHDLLAAKFSFKDSWEFAKNLTWPGEAKNFAPEREYKPKLAFWFNRDAEKCVCYIDNRKPLTVRWNCSEDVWEFWNIWCAHLDCSIYCLQVLSKSPIIQLASISDLFIRKNCSLNRRILAWNNHSNFKRFKKQFDTFNCFLF